MIGACVTRSRDVEERLSGAEIMWVRNQPRTSHWLLLERCADIQMGDGR